MKTLLASAAIVLATASGAFAASSALDVAPIYPETNNAAVDFVATAAIGSGVELETRGNLGDGSPQYDLGANIQHDVDFGATASIGAESMETRGRLGDGSPRY